MRTGTGSRWTLSERGASTIGVLIVGLIGTSLASCGGPGASATHSATAQPTTARSTPGTASAVLSAYRAGWAAFTSAARAADPSSPALDETMINPLLQAIHGELIRRQAEGAVLVGDIELNPRLISMSGSTATVADCTYDSSQFVFKSSGSPVPPAASPHHAGIRSTLMQVDGQWKVSDQAKDDTACSTA